MPACVVGDFCRIVQGIAVLANWRFARRVTQNPVLLKVSNVTDLPQEWVDDPQEGYAKLFIRQVTDKA